MDKLEINNPFTDAPVYYREVTDSTMDDSKKGASEGILHGTVFRAAYQEKGRGRIRGRRWLSEKGSNLMFTVVLDRNRLLREINHMPLIAGLALATAVREMTGADFKLKWPNDLLYEGKKCAGILCEADAKYFYCGMGINCNQIAFPGDISDKSSSLRIITDRQTDMNDLLCRILDRLKTLSENPLIRWRPELDRILYKRGELMEVLTGQAGSRISVRGINKGTGEDGQLLLEDENGEIHQIYAGEIEI